MLEMQQLLAGLLLVSAAGLVWLFPTSALHSRPSADPAEEPICLDQLLALGSVKKETPESSSAAAAASVSTHRQEW